MVAKLDKKLSSRSVEKDDVLEFINKELVPVVEKLRLLSNGLVDMLQSGEGSPNGVVSASRPALYFDTTGGAGSVYYKTTDDSDTGWVALP
jgi:hypothetical protein